MLKCAGASSLLSPLQQALPMEAGSAKCSAAAGRNARGGTAGPFDGHAPVIEGGSPAGIRESLEPQVLSQLLPSRSEAYRAQPGEARLLARRSPLLFGNKSESLGGETSVPAAGGDKISPQKLPLLRGPRKFNLI